MPRFLLVVLMLALLPSGPRPCLADGKIFAPGPARVEIPDQEALIVWRDGVQTLAIETRFIAPGHDFAWVVPLPARPTISPGTTGMFPTLRALCAPRLHGTVMNMWIPLLYASVFVLIAMRLTSSWLRIALLLVASLLLLTCLFLPALGSARGLSGAGPPVTVLERRVVGSYDVATIASTDPEALSSWLRDNSFTLGPAARPVIAGYVARGWVFAAARLRREHDTLSPSAPHPLVFTFPTKEPVYPLQLTGVDNGDLDVDLYILGPGRAAARGFRVERCAAIEIAEPQWYATRYPRTDVIELTHSGLVALAGPGLTLTKLSATLTPRQMSSDAVISFGPSRAYRPEYFTSRASRVLSANIAAGVFLAGILLTGALYPRSYRRVPHVLAAGLLSGVAAYAITPTLEEAGTGRNTWLRSHRLSEFAMHITGHAFDFKASGGTPTEAWVRQEIASYWAAGEKDGQGGFEEGDGPGCYSFAVSPSGEVTFTWHDDFGQEHRFAY